METGNPKTDSFSESQLPPEHSCVFLPGTASLSVMTMGV